MKGQMSQEAKLTEAGPIDEVTRLKNRVRRYEKLIDDLLLRAASSDVQAHTSQPDASSSDVQARLELAKIAHQQLADAQRLLAVAQQQLAAAQRQLADAEAARDKVHRDNMMATKQLGYKPYVFVDKCDVTQRFAMSTFRYCASTDGSDFGRIVAPYFQPPSHEEKQQQGSFDGHIQGLLDPLFDALRKPTVEIQQQPSQQQQEVNDQRLSTFRSSLEQQLSALLQQPRDC
jgi:hypothetical protein